MPTCEYFGLMTMNTIHPLNVLLVLLVLLCMKTSSFGSKDGKQMTMRCIEREREALLLFRQSVANEYDHLHSWNKEQQQDCCKWKGVGCDNRTGHVTHLLLASLISPFPSDLIYFGGGVYGPAYWKGTRVSISSSLLDLPHLKYLDLSSNHLYQIPDFIGSLKELVYLDFSFTLAGGSIPYQIDNISNLQYLNLSFNNFDGPIPKSIGSLNSLRYLDLSNSWLTGVIPHELGNLSKLQHLDLGSNYNPSGGGNFNWLYNLSSLTHLDLSDVPIDPPTIWASFIQRIPSLSVLRLSGCNLSAPSSGNYFSGVIPHELGNLSKLQHLDLGYNSNLKGGENFHWLFNLSSLTHLDLSGVPIDPPTIWASFIQRIPSLSVLRLSDCNLSAPSSTLSNFSSSIATLHLGYNHINSSIFEWLSHLSGSLVDLDLSVNGLEGRIPESFGYMTALTHLYLYGNHLTGMIPKSFGNSSSLQVAYFSSNNFTGNLEDFLSGPFPLLKRLYISENQLTGSMPDITLHSNLLALEVNSNQLNGYLPTVFEHHSALWRLDLSNNHLRGSLPDFTGFSSLTSLNLNNNEFFGRIPDFIGLSSLKILRLDNNELSGSVPDFTGCSSLQELQLGDNRLTEWETQSTGLLSTLEVLNLTRNSIHGTISELNIFNLSSLKYLDTSFNSLTFEFGSEWLPPFQLWQISLAACKLGPEFPNWIRNQRNIDYLDISNSRISDTIPIWFSNLSSVIHHLNLSSNKIRGTLRLPFSVVQNLSLKFLDLSHNQLCGTLPDNWKHFQGLLFLNLGYNNFSGRIPTSMGHLISLQTLILRNNKLNGELPTSLKNCSSLGFVDFGLNKLSGNVPSWIGEGLTQLYALILKSNRFRGSMPHEICHLANLHFLDVSINRISGTIPPCFDNLSSMINKGTEVTEHPYFSDNLTTYRFTDSVLARWKGQEFEYGRNFAYLKLIDLSTNELTGEIPTGIIRLLELKGLNLSGNRLYGNIPREIGQLKGLECLDLSTNNFSGEIPLSMSRLNFLAFLNLSDNNFSGRIPSGTQLQGFTTSTYEGNTRLCGKPLTNICPRDDPDDHVRPSSVEYGIDGDESEYVRWLYISVAFGFGTTFWGFVGTLVLNRRWRHAYFLFLDNLKVRFYVFMAVRIARLQRKI